MSTSSQFTPGRNQPFCTTSQKKGVPGWGAAMVKNVGEALFLRHPVYQRPVED